MNHLSFAVRYSLKPGDVVVVPKSQLNIVAHYVVYWGMNEQGVHIYLENNNHVGVRWITEDMFLSTNPTFKRIRSFNGTDSERIAAVNRAVSLLGNKYDLEKFNCENYANYCQYGVSYSKQVKEVKSGLAAAAAVVGVIAIAKLLS